MWRNLSQVQDDPAPLGTGFWDDAPTETQIGPESGGQGMVMVGNTPMTIEQVKAWAARTGQTDPTAFNLANIETTRTNKTRRDDMPHDRYRLSGWTNNNNENDLEYVEPEYDQSETGSNVPKNRGGWRATGGEIKGAKQYTRSKYLYDEKGNLKSVNLVADETIGQQLAPLVNIATTALTAGGGAGLVGGWINDVAGLGMAANSAWLPALGGAAIGGGSAALTGQNPIKGAALGGIGGAVTALNPAGAMGLAGDAAKGVNTAAGMAARSAISGRDPSPLAVLSALGSWR